MSETELSTQHKQAVELHQKILISANLAQQNLWDMCTSLKRMRDGKLYKELGYNNFEDYCETEVGMKRRNAYNYISVIEKVNAENVQSIAQIGMTKLSLLATISHEEQAEISEKVNLEETTVKNLKAEIDKLKAKNQQLEEDNEKTIDRLEELNTALNMNCKALKNAEQEKLHLEQQLEELQNRTVEIQPVDNSDNERRLQETIKSLERENIKRNEELERQYREDEQAVRKMLAKDKQNAIDQLTAEYEEKLKALQQTQQQSLADDKKVFEAYFKTVYDTFNRMVEFAKGSANKDIFKIKINNLISAFSDTNAKI